MLCSQQKKSSTGRVSLIKPWVKGWIGGAYCHIEAGLARSNKVFTPAHIQAPLGATHS